MKTKGFEKMVFVAAVLVPVFTVASCVIRLRDDKSETQASQPTSDPWAKKLAECRSVTPDQTEILSECRKAWAEQRRRFLDRRSAISVFGTGSPREEKSGFAPPKDQSRIAPGFPFLQSGRE
jgi:conjugative transfer region protein TrbK